MPGGRLCRRNIQPFERLFREKNPFNVTFWKRLEWLPRNVNIRIGSLCYLPLNLVIHAVDPTSISASSCQNGRMLVSALATDAEAHLHSKDSSCSSSSRNGRMPHSTAASIGIPSIANALDQYLLRINALESLSGASPERSAAAAAVAGFQFIYYS